MSSTQNAEPLPQEEQNKLAYNKVIALLARRDYSEKELVDKLKPHVNSEAISFGVHKAQAQGYQSDERFAFSFVRSKYDQGYGAYRIRMNLKQKGVAESWVEEALNQETLDWFERAAEVYQRKYKQPIDNDFKQRNKRTQFLVNRGFSFEQAKYAMEVGETALSEPF